MPGEIGAELEKETRKQLERIEREMENIRVTGNFDRKRLDPVIGNMRAYVSDCRHFLEKGDLINAFEAVVYAWGILETCRHLGVIRDSDEQQEA
jgi:hypothetical protein